MSEHGRGTANVDERRAAPYTPGSAPGLLRARPGARPTRMRAVVYSESELTERDVGDVAELKELLGSGATVWVDVVGLGDVSVISALGELFEIHPLALEDVVNGNQRPKAEIYADQLFVVARLSHLERELETEQIAFWLGKGFLLTFQERPGDCFEPVRDVCPGGIVVGDIFDHLTTRLERLEHLEGLGLAHQETEAGGSVALVG